MALVRTTGLDCEVPCSEARSSASHSAVPSAVLPCCRLDMCQLTSACCEALASALSVCRSLKSLNLDWISLERAGALVLCEALSHPDCALRQLG